MSSYTRIAAVTGANKGVGLACVRQLALQYPQSALNNGGFLIYLTARDKSRGEAALAALQGDPALREARALRAHGGLAELRYLALDIDSAESIAGFAAHLKREHPGGIDVLINNAGIAMDGFDADIVRKTVGCNYFGTLAVMEQLLPCMPDNALSRIVNVASTAGILDSKYSSRIRERFLTATRTEQVTALMKEFTEAVEQDTYKDEWPGSAYKVSKASEIRMTKIVAADVKDKGMQLLINSCCPGYVNTDMTKGRGYKTPDQGAKTPVMLALGDIGGLSGEFWRDEKVVSWEK